VDYYRQLIASYRERRRDGSYPSILINSIDLTRMPELVTENRLVELTEYLGSEVDRLARAGADYGLLASNTPHIVFEALSVACSIPLLSIVEAACEAAREMSLTKLGLLGTRFTMRGRFYHEVFGRHGITLRAPAANDLAYVHEKYMGELVRGDFRADTREGILGVIDRLVQEGADGILLAGTELPLLLRGTRDPGVPLLDTTRIHVRRAVTELLGSEVS
jgi:aspartate racemase